MSGRSRFDLLLFATSGKNGLARTRIAGVVENYAEGAKYAAEHSMRKYLCTNPPENMPSINSFFADPKP
ncbi:hypothetical protein vseg_003104 [Gypsophila vaccaria]